MKCPSCQTGNPEKAKFCVQCGNKLEIICPKCGTGNSPSFKFCMECGHGLSFPAEPSSKELSFDEKIEKIQKYLPGGLAEKILSQRDKIEGEKKQVTVLFADLEGFTPLVEKIGPEEAYSIMDEVYEILIHKVHDYEGTVNEMTGDGIMALFGAPIALEDAPQRAIQSAYAIHREMVRFRDGLKQKKEGIPPLKMRIGIHTGPVVVGTLGNDLRVEFKAVGDTVNQASRVEGLAEPGATYVTEETFKLTEGLFRFEALGEKAVKGKEEPIRVYRVIAPTTRRTRFDVSAERGLTPIVGRERELELLLDGFERCKLGRGEAFSIMAEAGVGKSRLLYEFRKAVANEDVTFLEGKCLSYSRNVAYHPITDILKANFDIRDGNADFEIREKVRAGLRNLGADEASTLPYILELLSLKDSGIDKVPLSFEEKNDRITKALKWIVLKNSQIRPLIMAIEDLHWIDKSSEKFLKDISDSIQGAKVLLLFTYRPEFLHTWGGKSHHTQVTLNLLSKRETLKMVTILLNAEAIDKGLEDLILKKTEGVPFFIEEFIRSFNDLRIIKREDSKYYLAGEIQGISIPSTIQDVITARVDSLPQKAKKVLQAGSAIEREFDYEIIRRVTDLSQNDLLSSLSVLKNSDLVFERGIFPESSYVFRHALTQEIVYDSILTEKKKRLHENIGNSIVELYKNRIEEHYEILAEHFVIAENYEKGAHYSKLASKKAEKAGFFNDSIFYLKKRIACLEKLPQTNKVQEQIVDTRVVLGIHYTTLNHHVVSKQCVDPIVNLTRKLGLQNRISQIATILGSYYFMVEENYVKSIDYFEEALNISEKKNDPVSLFLINWWLGIALSSDCQFEKAVSNLEKALEFNLFTNHLTLISVVKSVISHLSYFNWGKIDLAYQMSGEAVQVAEEVNDIHSLAMAYTAHGVCSYGKGYFEQAIEYLLKALDFSEKIDYFSYVSFSNLFLGKTYFEVGNFPKAGEHYDRGASALKSVNIMPTCMNLNKIGSIRSKVMNNEWNFDFEHLLTLTHGNRARVFEGWIQRYIGEILLNCDDQCFLEAETCIQNAIEADNRNGMIWHLGGDHALHAELYKRKGDQIKARENLQKAIEIIKECGADGWVEKYQKELAAVS